MKRWGFRGIRRGGVVLLALFVWAHAKPFEVNDILVQRQELNIYSSWSYYNLQSKNIAPLMTKVGVVIGQKEQNQDYLSASLGARYGIWPHLEVFAEMIGYYQHTSIANRSPAQNGLKFDSRDVSGIGALNLGLVYELFGEGRYPSLYVGGLVEILSQTALGDAYRNLQYLKSYSLKLASFYSADPLVFSLQAEAQKNLNRKAGDFAFNPGEILSLSPLIYFAANPYATLHWGLKYRFQTRDFFNGLASSIGGSALGYTFGLDYEIQKKLLLSVGAELLNTNDFDSKQVMLTLSYKF